MAESEWNYPLIIIFLAFFIIIGISMAIPDSVTTIETCKTIDGVTICTTMETFR